MISEFSQKQALSIAKELRSVEGLTGPHPRLEGKESSIQREGLLLEAANCIEALASRAQTDLISAGCKCSLAISLTGDGCRYCQPQTYIDSLGDIADDERQEKADLISVIRTLAGTLSMFKNYRFGDGDFTHAIQKSLALAAPFLEDTK